MSSKDTWSRELKRLNPLNTLLITDLEPGCGVRTPIFEMEDFCGWHQSEHTVKNLLVRFMPNSKNVRTFTN